MKCIVEKKKGSKAREEKLDQLARRGSKKRFFLERLTMNTSTQKGRIMGGSRIE